MSDAVDQAEGRALMRREFANGQCLCPQEARSRDGWSFRPAQDSPVRPDGRVFMVMVHNGCDRPIASHGQPWVAEGKWAVPAAPRKPHASPQAMRRASFIVEGMIYIQGRGPTITRCDAAAKAAHEAGEMFEKGDEVVCNGLRARVVGIERYAVLGPIGERQGALILDGPEMRDIHEGQVWVKA